MAPPPALSPRASSLATSLHHQVETRTARAAASVTPSAPTGASPMRPKRPLSASRVRVASSSTARPASRPTSASRRRQPNRPGEDVDTPVVHAVSPLPTSPGLDSPVKCLDDSSSDRSPSPPSMEPVAALPPTTDPATAHARFQTFLAAWAEEQSHFRSPALFSESTFAQAKAMVIDWPRPNAFLSAVALGALEQLALALERQLPFLRELVRELGAAVYANADELAALAAGGSSRLPLLFDRGRLWFQELAGERQRVHTLRCATRASEDEVARLSELMQEQHAARAVERVQHRVQLVADAARRRSQHGDELGGGQSTLPLLSRLLRPRDGRAAVSDDWLDAHGGFQLFSVEVRRVFEALGDAEALKLTRALLEAGADRQLPLLGEALAVGVDQLAEPARREFLREYFAFIESDELQAALRHRDERNNDRRLEELVAELVDALKLYGGGGSSDGGSSDAAPQSGTATFHSDEARVLKRALDQRELLEDVAAELAFLDDAASAALPERLRNRLRPYETAAKRVAKAQELMARASSARPIVPVVVPVVQPAAPVCGCACGRHRLVSVAAAARLDALDAAANAALDPPASLEPQQPETKPVDPSEGVDSEQRKARRRSTVRRPQSAGARRKNGVNFGSQLAARRGSVAGGGGAAQRLFPLAEVCHLLAAAVQLQFSRDAAEEAANAAASAASTAVLEGVSLLAGDGRWAFLRRRAPPFKALARDLLVRRYGIRSIAAMHALQLERSLAHYAAADGHARCELFAWFLGAADPRRAASRDFAFRFFQRLVKAVMRLCAARKPAPSSPPKQQQQLQEQQPALAFSAVVAAWSETIGDGDGPATGPDAKLLAAPLALEALRQALPEAMRPAAEVAALQQRLHRAGIERKSVEVELFLRRAMDAWQLAFEPLAAAVEATLAREPQLDVAGFGRCLAAHGLELSTGERLELFDLLAREADEDARGAGVLGSRQLARFVLEAQYLRAGS